MGLQRKSKTPPVSAFPYPGASPRLPGCCRWQPAPDAPAPPTCRPGWHQCASPRPPGLGTGASSLLLISVFGRPGAPGTPIVF